MIFIDLFAGIGGFRFGFEKINQNNKCSKNENGGVGNGDKRRNELYPKLIIGQRFTCVYSNEWDKYARQIYIKHYGECDSRDIRTVEANEIPDHDLICAGFPCQSFSVAGKRGGFEDTRGTLFFEICRIARAKRPHYLLLENVKGLLSHDKGNTFATIISTLDELGYDCEWCVLNSKNFGVPQNRERVFIVGHIRGESRTEIFPIEQEIKLDKKTQPKNGKEIQTYRCIEGTEYKGYSAERFDGIYQDMKIRRLTPTECERLQGFPDDWTEGISDTQRYKCLGNAVTTTVITEIGKRLIQEVL